MFKKPTNDGHADGTLCGLRSLAISAQQMSATNRVGSAAGNVPRTLYIRPRGAVSDQGTVRLRAAGGAGEAHDMILVALEVSAVMESAGLATVR